jgi:hypothetical protein
VAAKKNPHPEKKKENYPKPELLAESKCNQQPANTNTAAKTELSAKSLRRRWCKRGPQQLLK